MPPKVVLPPRIDKLPDGSKVISPFENLSSQKALQNKNRKRLRKAKKSAPKPKNNPLEIVEEVNESEDELDNETRNAEKEKEDKLTRARFLKFLYHEGAELDDIDLRRIYDLDTHEIKTVPYT